MQSWNWQTIIALICVAAAAAALIRRVIRLLRGKAGSGCGDCPKQNAAESGVKTRPFVPIDAIKGPDDPPAEC